MVPNQNRITVEIEETDNADYSILIDGIESPWYSFTKQDQEYGYRRIDIKVYQGKIKISPTSIARYCGKTLIQNNYIDWFYSDLYQTDVWYDHDIYFYHLFAQGPSYFLDGKAVWTFDPIWPVTKAHKSANTKIIRGLICQ